MNAMAKGFNIASLKNHFTPENIMEKLRAGLKARMTK